MFVGAGSKQSMENWCMRRCDCNLSLKILCEFCQFRFALVRFSVVKKNMLHKATKHAQKVAKSLLRRHI